MMNDNDTASKFSATISVLFVFGRIVDAIFVTALLEGIKFVYISCHYHRFSLVMFVCMAFGVSGVFYLFLYYIATEACRMSAL